MGEVPLERRFAGQARLVRLLLWRTGDSTDLDACLAAAYAAGMVTREDESFLRACMDAEERLRETGCLEIPVDAQLIVRLQRMADKLNRADSA